MEGMKINLKKLYKEVKDEYTSFIGWMTSDSLFSQMSLGGRLKLSSFVEGKVSGN